jgi:hypothetical protein
MKTQKQTNQTGDNIILFICMGIFIVGIIAGYVKLLFF